MIKMAMFVINYIKKNVYKFELKLELIILKIYSLYLNRNKENSKRILIVKPDAIGDFIIFSRYLQAYIDLYKGYKIDLLINKVNYELAETCEKINKIISIDRKLISTFDKLKLIKYITDQKYEKVIYPVNSRDATGDKICILSNAKEKITFSGDDCNMSDDRKLINNQYFSTVISSSNNLDHEKMHNEEFLIKLGYKENEFETFIKTKEENVRFLNQYIRANEKYIVLVPGCQSLIRFWGKEKYAELIEYLCNQKKIKVIILGSKSETELVGEILSKAVIENMDLLINLVGKTNLLDMVTIISNGLLYIGSETSAVHIAELYNVKSICIIGGGHYNKFYPYPNSKLDYPVTIHKSCFNCNWKCIYDEAKCIKEVDSKEVKEIVNNII